MKTLFFLFVCFLLLSSVNAQQNWSSAGNSGINPATEFLGTTDNVPLLIRINNVQSGKIASNGFVSLGYEANSANAATTNTAIGHQAFKSITGGADWSTSLGYQAGFSTTSGDNSTFIGFRSGYANSTGRSNTGVGTYALGGYLTDLKTGSYNAALGGWSLYDLTSGQYNTAVGYQAGRGDATNINNSSFIDNNCVFLGTYASRDASVSTSTALTNAIAIGYDSKVSASNSMALGGIGSNAVNVGIGNTAPQNRLEITHGTSGNSGLRFTNLTSSSSAGSPSGKLLSVNSNGDVVLQAGGDGSETIVQAGTNVTVTGTGTSGNPYIVSASQPTTYWTASGIGSNNVVNSNAGAIIIGTGITTLPSGYKLYVSDGILAEKVKVALKSGSNWADYVFAKDYKLRSLAEVESFIHTNKHLPGMPSAGVLVKEGGIDVNQMFAKQMEKIEELTLYIIEMNKKLEKLEKENNKLRLSAPIVNQ